MALLASSSVNVFEAELWLWLNCESELWRGESGGGQKEGTSSRVCTTGCRAEVRLAPVF